MESETLQNSLDLTLEKSRDLRDLELEYDSVDLVKVRVASGDKLGFHLVISEELKLLSKNFSISKTKKQERVFIKKQRFKRL
jgi:hypothetical protein